jgi:hypothetical protein
LVIVALLMEQHIKPANTIRMIARFSMFPLINPKSLYPRLA